MSTTFLIKDCHLSLIATGAIAGSLRELRDSLDQIPLSSLYYHFWGGKLRISFGHPEYHNDFARFAHFGLRDEILRERLSILDPTEYKDLEDLRKQLIDIVEDRLEEVSYTPATDDKLYCLRSVIVLYDTNLKIEAPSDLKTILPKLSLTSIFYHFIDARRRTSMQSDDFSLWLSQFDHNYGEIIDQIQKIDAYFIKISEIKQNLTEIFNKL